MADEFPVSEFVVAFSLACPLARSYARAQSPAQKTVADMNKKMPSADCHRIKR